MHLENEHAAPHHAIPSTQPSLGHSQRSAVGDELWHIQTRQCLLGPSHPFSNGRGKSSNFPETEEDLTVNAHLV